MTSADVLDLMLRSGAAGVCVVLAAILLRPARHSLSARFGVLFALGAAAYGVASASLLQAQLPGLANTIKPFAIMTPVFFWWFGLSLFCDTWRWRPIYLTPLVLVVVFTGFKYAGAPEPLALWTQLFVEGVHIVLVLHVMAIIAMGSGDDLVEPRRQMRACWMGAMGVAIIGAAIVSALRLKTTMPEIVLTIEAACLLITACLFSAWALAAREDFFPAPAKAKPAQPVIDERQASDRLLIGQLRETMAAETYRTAGLSVGRLADMLGVREHRLRAVINHQLGYRNFAAFLNEYRIKAAKQALSDPKRVDEQILQIALDLGYGSIAPFNRAFRDLTGDTPTGYRRKALAGTFF